MTHLTPSAFVAKWRGVTLTERSASQSHFNDLCAMLGLPTPIEADPTGDWYTFEAGADKQSGGSGWADVWKKGYFAWEYKGTHANLDKAYQQLLQYRESLQNPPLVEAIAQAARELVEKRDTWLNPPGATEAELNKRTLTNLYNQRPTWLELAHRRLDEAVFAAYGWPAALSDEAILERLLALNLARAGAAG